MLHTYTTVAEEGDAAVLSALKWEGPGVSGGQQSAERQGVARAHAREQKEQGGSLKSAPRLQQRAAARSPGLGPGLGSGSQVESPGTGATRRPWSSTLLTGQRKEAAECCGLPCQHPRPDCLSPPSLLATPSPTAPSDLTLALGEVDQSHSGYSAKVNIRPKSGIKGNTSMENYT